jgi:hypothetical protein
MLRKTIFTIGVYPKAYIGYTSGRLWNGWATPFFEKAEADKVAEGFNECAEFPMQYDEVYDQFYILDTETEELEKWVGTDYSTTEGIKHLYGIGAYSWVWDEEATDRDCYYLAQGIEDFIYEYDTYHYHDEGIDREEMVDKIKNQLKELTVFQQVYEIWHNDELTSDEKFEALGGILK